MKKQKNTNEIKKTKTYKKEGEASEEYERRKMIRIRGIKRIRRRRRRRMIIRRHHKQ